MNATNKLLDKWTSMRAAKLGGAITPSAIAIELGVKRTSIANYRAGTSQAAPHVISKMARDIGDNPAAWLALVESERARDANDRKAWAAVARQLGAAAAVAAITLCAMPTHAKAPSMLVSTASEFLSMHIMLKISLHKLHERITAAAAP